MSAIVPMLAVAATSVAGTAAARAYALRRRLVDEPGGLRRAHAAPTPRGGGAGPVIAILAWMLMSDAARNWPAALGVAGVALVGAWDDHRPLAPWWRLAVHVLAGVAVASGLVDASEQPALFLFVVGLVAVLVNVWNFMDGINGIAASQAAIVAVAIACSAAAMQGAGIAVAVACAGFLPFNFPRARVFLGDVGSGGLGVALAWLASGALVDSARPVDMMLLALPLSAFLVDAGLTLSRRVLRGERWWQPHAQHLYQHLARRHGHTPVTLAYALWSAAAATVMTVYWGASRPFIMTSVVVCYTTAALLWLMLQRQVATGSDAPGMRDR